MDSPSALPPDFRPAYVGVRAIVLGGTGFIGRWVARKLSAAGAHVSLTARNCLEARAVIDAYGIRGEVHELDLRDRRAVGNLVERLRPAIVFNLAGYGVDRTEVDEDVAHAINVDLVTAVCALMAEFGEPSWRGQAVVHTGSAMEYGACGGNLAEDTPPLPSTMYGRSKLAGTQALERGCRQHSLRGLTARLFAVYGPGEHPERLLPTLIGAAFGDAPIPLTAGRHERDFIHVGDVAEGLLRLGLTSDQTAQPVNVATGVLSSVRRFVETAAEVLGIAGGRLCFGVLPTRPEEMRHDPVSIERLHTLTGWTPPTSIREGVQQTLQFAGGAARLPAVRYGG